MTQVVLHYAHTLGIFMFHFYNYEVERQRQMKQVNYTQDNSSFQGKKELPWVGFATTRHTNALLLRVT